MILLDADGQVVKVIGKALGGEAGTLNTTHNVGWSYGIMLHQLAPKLCICNHLLL